MIRTLLCISAALITLGMHPASADECADMVSTVNKATGMPMTRTDWKRISGTTYLAAAESGNEKYLAVKWSVTDYYPKPLDIKQKDPEFDEFLANIKNNTFVFPADTSLRVKFDDRTTEYLPLTAAVSAVGEITKPNKKPKMSGSSNLLANALGADIEGVDQEKTPNWRVDAEVRLLYAVDADAELALSRKGITEVRLESHDRYYHSKLSFGIKDAFSASAGRTGQAAQKAAALTALMNCVMGEDRT
jgi:hypothetical protein